MRSASHRRPESGMIGYVPSPGGRLLRQNDLSKAVDYASKRWDAFTEFLAGGQVCSTYNAAEISGKSRLSCFMLKYSTSSAHNTLMTKKLKRSLPDAHA